MDPKRDHNFDNHVYDEPESELLEGDYIGAYTGGHYRGYRRVILGVWTAAHTGD